MRIASPGRRGLPALAAAAAGAWLLAACAPARPSPGETPPEGDPPALRTIYLVQGNGDHVWHDSAGTRRHADEDALRRALAAASRMQGEAFAFHRKTRRPLFGKRTDGAWFHYRDGKRLAEGRYADRPGDSLFAAEARVLRERGGTREAPAGTRVLLAWFGHEIPPDQNANGGASFGISAFAGGLSRLRPGAETARPYDLVVISACYGGNPALLRALAPRARHIVASPAYLHLSHLDVSAFGDPMARDTGAQSLARLADTVAARSFERLKTRTRTEITVATYDAERIIPFLSGEETGVHAERKRAVWVDCAGLPGFDGALAEEGTRLLYRPPEFGANKEPEKRSPWQCRAAPPQRTTRD